MFIEFIKNFLAKNKTHEEFFENCYQKKLSALLFCHGQKPYKDNYNMYQWSFEGSSGANYRVNYLVDGALQEFIEDDRIVVRDAINEIDLKKLKTLFIDKTQHQIDYFINELKQFPHLPRNDIKLVKENKSFEWLTHSCDFLTKSIETAANDSKYILKYFMYLETKPHEFLNLKIFNLEFIIVFNENKLLLEVYDYGNSTENRTLKLKDDFQYIHMQVFDEILKLIILSHDKLLSKF